MSAEIIGSIPVHTGKPISRFHLRYDGLGLSPYTRGNLVQIGIKQTFKGSIPVHTGKPGSRSHAKAQKQVYPRTHGETSYGKTFMQ